jgi:acyl carrier protein
MIRWASWYRDSTRSKERSRSDWGCPVSDVTGDVIAIIAKKQRAGRDKVEVSDRLEDLGLESLDAVEMIFDLEEKFDIQIPYNANTNNPRTEFETVGDVVTAVQKLIDKKKS